jgi:hypothetical protein
VLADELRELAQEVGCALRLRGAARRERAALAEPADLPEHPDGLALEELIVRARAVEGGARALAAVLALRAQAREPAARHSAKSDHASDTTSGSARPAGIRAYARMFDAIDSPYASSRHAHSTSERTHSSDARSDCRVSRPTGRTCRAVWQIIGFERERWMSRTRCFS